MDHSLKTSSEATNIRTLCGSRRNLHPDRKDSQFLQSERNSQDNMGFTAEVMEKAFSSLGFRTVFSQKVPHRFKAGEENVLSETPAEAEYCGLKLKRTIELQRSR